MKQKRLSFIKLKQTLWKTRTLKSSTSDKSDDDQNQ